MITGINSGNINPYYKSLGNRHTKVSPAPSEDFKQFKENGTGQNIWFGSTNLLYNYKQKNGFGSECLAGNTRTSIFYINDYHGKAINMERTVTASNIFDQQNSGRHTDKLKLASGDIMLGEDPKVNKIAVKFMNYIGITATAVGNHECDMKSQHFIDTIQASKQKLLACNLKTSADSPINKYVEKSFIQEVNGNKYGIIGVLPTDIISRVKYGKVFQDQKITPVSIDKTIQCIQQEVDKLKKQGVNKIILLSHSGYGYDIKIAKNTDGVDIILGGHSHNLIKDIENGKNLFLSKSGEPVVITQAGRDGKNFGVLNVEFDKNGIIKKVQNNVGTTRIFSRNAVARKVFEKIQGKAQVLGEIRTAPPILQNDLIEPNALAYYGLDEIRSMTGADIALVGAANIRGYVEKGKIDTGTTCEISPFKNKIVKVKYTEKEIVDAIKFCAKSFVNVNNKPGIMYVSGLKYTVSKNGLVYDMSYLKRDGTEEKIDVENPREDKIYSVAINDYYSSGNDGMTMLNKIFEAEEHYDWDLNYAIEQRILNTKGPVDILDDGRIKIVD